MSTFGHQPLATGTRLQVTCKVALYGSYPHNHLLRIGGSAVAKHWHRTEAEAMLLMLEKKEQYYVKTPDGEADLVIATYVHKGFTHTYLKASTDLLEPLSLDALPECAECDHPN